MTNKPKIINHVILHNIELVFKDIKTDMYSIQSLDHAVTRYIDNFILNDTNKEFVHNLIIISYSIDKKYDWLVLQHTHWYTLTLLKWYWKVFPLEISLSLRSYIKNINKDEIIHIHWTWSFMYDFIAPLLRGKKSIVHYRWWHFTWKSFPISFFKYWILQVFTLRYPKKIFIESNRRINIYKHIYWIDKSKIVYIPWSIDIEKYNNCKFNEGSKQINLLFVWRLEKAKWIVELIQIYRWVKKRIKNKIINLYIAGDWSLKDLVIRETKKDSSIVYTWHIDSEQLRKLYQKSNIFLLPTKFESFGLVLIEAMASYLPVISTNCEWPINIIDNYSNWFIISKNKNLINNFINKIVYLILNDTKRKEMWSLARKKVENNFSWKIIFKKIIKEYKNLF